MRSFAAATIMGVTYGYEVVPKDDPFVTKIEHLLSLVLAALTPERAALLLAFPFCMSSQLRCCIAALIVDVLVAHIPSWLPGGEYKQRAAECRALAKEVLTTPVEYVKENMVIIVISF